MFVAWSGLLILEFKSLMWGEKCYNNERPTGQKQQLFDGRTGEYKGKLILTETFPLMQNMIFKSIENQERVTRK